MNAPFHPETISLDQHQPLLLFGILLGLAGLQFLTVGLLAEMQVRTYHESQGKPIYAIRRTIEAPSSPAVLDRDRL